MRADPIPHDFVTFQDSDCSITRADPSRINWPCRMNRLETKTRLVRVLSEDTICAAGLTLNVWRQFGKHLPELRSRMRYHNFSGSSFSVRPARCSANASSASSASRSCDPAKSSSHRRSEASSSSNMRPSVSCSPSGSFEASSNAFWSSFVITTVEKYIKNSLLNHLPQPVAFDALWP
jgi:hypothetical protein